MLFSEIYGSYYNTVAAILTEAVRGDLKPEDMYDLIRRKAFGESMLNIPPALGSGEWPLLTDAMETPLKAAPQMPLTTLQKRWMKALLADPRIRLFDVPQEGLEDVQPLYGPETFVYFDQFSDGDPYEDEGYVQRFRTVLQALRERRRLQISFTGGKGNFHRWNCVPIALEYSLRDDKFRLITRGRYARNLINLGRVTACELLEGFSPEEAQAPEPEKDSVTLLLKDERNALERAMLQFSHLEKETVRLGGGYYEVTLRYDRDEETELLIRILGFGPMVEVTGPEHFRELIRDRLQRQRRRRETGEEGRKGSEV